ncbi:uncharacterized protein EAF02_003568 [Botrytis sinoallii]|uniref:uncharacterized protein n=1 Tax=Botrytis sinoallii TaxID=1463999 RepID=UPI0019008826|nr:uncharacterized protein EAF02_003568 [Botrytis sinoallii]KAF7886921.1 hypothetical protein EAF02_003568 [Botrytis sinoallii]
MADITGRRRRDFPYSRPGLMTLSEGRAQSLSGKTEVGRSFSSRDSADLSGTIQGPDERPAIRPQAVFAGGLRGGSGPGSPGTGDGEIGLSGIGRPAQGTGQPSPKPAETEKDPNFKIPAPTKGKPPPLDISQFKNPDGTYDMARIQAVVSTRVQAGVRETRAERRAERARGSMAPVPAMKPLDTTQATAPLSRAEEVNPLQSPLKDPLQGDRWGGRGKPPRRPRRPLFLSPDLSPIAERSSTGSKKTENFESPKKTGGGEDLETGEVDSHKGKEPTGEEDKADRPAAEEPVADDEGSLYGASPPRHPVQKPLPHDSNNSPGQSEKYRRWAAEPAESPTVEEKFKEWIDRDRSSESKTAAQELEAWAQNDLYDAREKHLAWLFEQRSVASRRLKIETDQSKILQLQNVIIRCTLGIKESIRLEERRQSLNTLRNNVELETNVLVKLRLQELLEVLEAKIELEEKVELVKLQVHMRPDSVWQKAKDMTPAERAVLEMPAGHHFAAPAQQPPPMVLRESFAEQLLRDKWEKEDAPEELEDLFDQIGEFSDSEDRDIYWEAFQDIRRPILLQRNKELTDLWKEQADERNKEEEEVKKRQFADALAATGVHDAQNAPPVVGQRKRMDISGLVVALKGKGVVIPEPSTQGEKDSGRKGLLSVRTAPKGAGDGGEAETAVTVNRNISLPEPRPGSPFRPGKSLSSIQEQRSSLTFETDREVADFLEYLTMVRNNEEVVRTGEGELIDSELMRVKEKSVMNPGPINPAEEEKSQKRIRAAKKRLEKLVARLMMSKEELKALEEKEHQQRKGQREEGSKQELKDEETARGKGEADEKKKEEERKRDELAKADKAEKERKEREAREMALRDQINREREEKEKAAQIARDKIAKDLKDKEDKKKPGAPIDVGDILNKIKDGLLTKAGAVTASLDDLLAEAKRVNPAAGGVTPSTPAGKGEDKPGEKPPAEQKAEAEKKRAEMQKKAQQEEDEKRKRDKIAQDKNDEIERKERERVEKEQAQEALKEKKLADERGEEKIGGKMKKQKERGENERLEREAKDKLDRLVDEQIDRLQKELKQNEILQKENEKKRQEQEKKDKEDRLIAEKANQWDNLQREKAKKQKEKDQVEREERLARDHIEKKRKERGEVETSVTVENLESEAQNPELRKEKKEREKKEQDKKDQEEAAALAKRAQGGGLFQSIAGRFNFPDISWLSFRGPTHLQGRAGTVAPDGPSPSIRTPVPADYELAPVDIAWMHAYASESAERRKISLNLTIFTSAKQHFPGAAPPHYLVCHDIPILWNVSQLKRHLSAIVQRAKVGERKIVKLRIERRWLKNGSRTLLDEGFRDWESVVVVMVEKGWIEGWPGKGALRMPVDRKVWLAEAFEGVFESPVFGE